MRWQSREEGGSERVKRVMKANNGLRHSGTRQGLTGECITGLKGGDTMSVTDRNRK